MLQQLYISVHRNPGDEKTGEPPAPIPTLEELMPQRRGKQPQSKKVEAPHDDTLGAQCDVGSWVAYVSGKNKVTP